MSDDQPSLDARLGSDVSEYQLQHLGSSAVMSVDETGNPHNPPGAFYCVVDEAITEVDDATGSVYTAYGFLVMWRGRQSGGYRRAGAVPVANARDGFLQLERPTCA